MIITGFDLETTGLDQVKGHKIIEIAMILYDMDSQRELGRYVKRINPQRSIDPGAQAVHGISFEDVSGCPVWEDVADKVIAILKKSDVVVAHNGESFDGPFIAGELLRIGKSVPPVQMFDTCVEGRWATSLGKMPSLKELCFACGVDYDPAKAHGAAYDVEVMMESFFVGHRKGFFTSKVFDKAAP